MNAYAGTMVYCEDCFAALESDKGIYLVAVVEPSKCVTCETPITPDEEDASVRVHTVTAIANM